MNQKSPFEQWRENHLYQIAVSPEILKLIAEAFQGGRLYEMQPFQKREWVGLTKEQLATTDWSADFRAGALWAEAKLKEKNGVRESPYKIIGLPIANL